MTTVFLGGTCNESTWRDELIAQLGPQVSAYNPVVPDWTPECMAEEIRQRESSEYCLYVITPRMTGVYSIAEVVDDSNKRSGKTLFAVVPKDGEVEFTGGQMKSLHQVGNMVRNNGGQVFAGLEEVAAFLNQVSR